MAPAIATAVNDQLVSMIDLAPTVLALAGVEIPAHLQGRVLVGPKAAAAAGVRVRAHAIAWTSNTT